MYHRADVCITVLMYVSPCCCMFTEILINECESDLNNCHANATCTDTVDDFTCACNEGFKGNGVNCTGA